MDWKYYLWEREAREEAERVNQSTWYTALFLPPRDLELRKVMLEHWGLS